MSQKNGRGLPAYRFVLGAGLLVAFAISGVAVTAANPHLVSAQPTTGEVIFTGPATFAWDAGLTVPFKVAGLGKNPGIQVKLNAGITVNVGVKATTTNNTVDANVGFTLPGGFAFSAAAIAESPGTASVSAFFSVVDSTYSGDRNGHVNGTLVVPALIRGSIPDKLACVQVIWRNIVLTVGGQTYALPDVERRFNMGSFCS